MADLLAECGLKPGEEGLLPLREPKRGTKLPADTNLAQRYGWPIYPKDFTGDALREQARCLLWTCAPVARRAAGPRRR